MDCPRCGQRMMIPGPVAATLLAAVAASRPAEEAGPEPSLTPPMFSIDFEELIDMTAMVDIVFFLLIFFLVTSMHALDSTIPMPVPNPDAAASSGGGGSSADSEGDDDLITVNIDRNDVIRIEGTEIAGPRDLLFKLRDLRNSPARPDKLLVVGHGDATHGVAVMVLDAGHEVGMESVRLAVRDELD
jgi:biopolymer transport protein ExbD